MKKYLLPLAGCLAISTATSSAALLFTFTEKSEGVEMRPSGTVDLTNSRFQGESPKTGFFDYRVDGGGLAVCDDRMPGVYEIYTGVDLFGGDLTNLRYIGQYENEYNGDFAVNGSDVFAFSTSDHGIVGDLAPNATVVSLTTAVFFEGETFNSMGLDLHVMNTVHDLWGATATASDSEKVQFVVSTGRAAVPEPSSMALLGLGSLGLLLRRRH